MDVTAFFFFQSLIGPLNLATGDSQEDADSATAVEHNEQMT